MSRCGDCCGSDPVRTTEAERRVLLVVLLLSRYRDGDINLRATWICSRNDMLGNLEVLLAAALVARLGVLWPDIVIGLIIAAVVVRSAVRIVREARARLSGDLPANLSGGCAPDR